MNTSRQRTWPAIGGDHRVGGDGEHPVAVVGPGAGRLADVAPGECDGETGELGRGPAFAQLSVRDHRDVAGLAGLKSERLRDERRRARGDDLGGAHVAERLGLDDERARLRRGDPELRLGVVARSDEGGDELADQAAELDALRREGAHADLRADRAGIGGDRDDRRGLAVDRDVTRALRVDGVEQGQVRHVHRDGDRIALVGAAGIRDAHVEAHAALVVAGHRAQALELEHRVPLAEVELVAGRVDAADLDPSNRQSVRVFGGAAQGDVGRGRAGRHAGDDLELDARAR